jgi:recombination protein RecA
MSALSIAAARTRQEVEGALARKAPSALSPRPRTIRERMVCGVKALDALLEGGLPVGAISEFVGVTGSGRTTVAMAFAAATAREAKVAAWVDVNDAFDPAGAALNGVELERLLWVRCRKTEAEVAAGLPGEQTPAAAAPEAAVAQPPAMAVRGGGSPHPRSEGNGMPEAISTILNAHGGLHDHQTRRERRMIGTPGAPNRQVAKPQSPMIAKPLGRVMNREEQAPTDRHPKRRDVQAMEAAQGGPKCAEAKLQRRVPSRARNVAMLQPAATVRRGVETRAGFRNTWTALDHALRATDLLLQSGGFGLIVLDLGDTPAEMAWRIPLATWFRFRAGCERSRTCLLVLTQHPCARSSAELVVRMRLGAMEAEGGVMAGIAYGAEVERRRFANAESVASSVSVRDKVVAIHDPRSQKRDLGHPDSSWGLENRKPVRRESDVPGRWKARAAWAV